MGQYPPLRVSRLPHAVLPNSPSNFSTILPASEKPTNVVGERGARRAIADTAAAASLERPLWYGNRAMRDARRRSRADTMRNTRMPRATSFFAHSHHVPP